MADTGGLLRALARRPGGGAAWPEFERILRSAPVVVVPALVLAEVDYFLRSNRPAMRRLVDDIVDPATTYRLEPTTSIDLMRAMALDAKFRALEIGLVDGIVAAVAERLRIARVLTIDHSDFGPLRIGPRFDRALEVVPEAGV